MEIFSEFPLSKVPIFQLPLLKVVDPEGVALINDVPVGQSSLTTSVVARAVPLFVMFNVKVTFCPSSRLSGFVDFVTAISDSFTTGVLVETVLLAGTESV